MSNVSLSSIELGLVKKILAAHLPKTQVKVFGSRVQGRSRSTSDLDLAIFAENPLDDVTLMNLKDAFSESDLSFKVDIVEWAKISNPFKAIVEKDFVIIQDGEM